MMKKGPKIRMWTQGFLLSSLLVFSVLANPYPAQPAPTSEKKKTEETSKPPSKGAATAPTASPAAAAPVEAKPTPAEAKNLIVDAPPRGVTPTQTTDMNIAVTKRIELANHGTYVINLKQQAGQVLLTDPKVADVQLVTPSTIYVYGRSPGVTEVVVTGQDMQTAYRYQINVTSDFRELQNLIQGIAPHNRVKVHSVPDGLLLQGTVDTAKAAEDIRALSQRYVGAQGIVVNQLKIKASTQVCLRVKIAEVKKTVINQLGIRWSTTPFGTTTNPLRFGLFNGTNNAAANVTLNGVTGLPSNFSPLPIVPIPGAVGANFPTKFGRTDFSVLIDALAQESLATVLAEPNLVTRSGEEASFLVGGQYPYPVSQGSGQNLTVSIQFKDYGISLSFLPVVIGDSISLRVRPEVSDLDNSIFITDQNGNRIPSIRTRRAESTMEMTNGQSMIMAGLLSDQSSGTINNFPGLGDIPIIGALLRSTAYQNSKTELIIIVTPYIVEPIDNPDQIILPTQGLKFANLMEMILFNRINEKTSPTSTPTPSLIGNAGFYF